MKKFFSTVIIFLSATTFAFANHSIAPSTNVKASVILHKIEQMGYKNIREFEFEHGVYKLDGYKDGVKFVIYVNPETGNIIKRPRSPASVPMSTVAKKLDSKNNQYIYKIELEHGSYKVKLLSNGHYRTLYVSPATGKLIND